ncbi:uncharacterized protein ALTATR162_LOCUS5157 [Alternaria atra]|uniref:Uncharacterized protein n=1 Tax=Alternaria atra TaxID=119953 RepID=A0A8J2I4E4_9PLEO|nr:uncharacterized protein ALTATR162_LOCUS5157 [Alternaria atra]CAG5158593.1 unnamed protein product [Alternaria atra]
MAPRSQGYRHDAARSSGERRVRNANTGAGVNSRRLTAAASCGGSNAQKGRRTQPKATSRAAVPRPQNGRASRPPGSRRPVAHDASRSLQNQGLAARMSTRVDVDQTTGVADDDYDDDGRPTATLPIRNVNSSSSQQSTLFGGSKLTRIFPESQRRLDPISPAGRESPFTISPNPIRLFNRTRDSIFVGDDTNNSNNKNDGQDSNATPSPVKDSYQKRPTSPTLVKRRPIYRGTDIVKRAVTNPKLRAIFADRPYPKERKKCGGERPVLKMGITKEYK